MAIIKRIDVDKKLKYQVRVRDNRGGWFPAETFDRMSDALKFERSLLVQRDKGLKNLKEFSELEFGSYWKMWEKDCRSNVSNGWKSSQNQMYKKYLAPFIDQKKLKNIGSLDVVHILKDMHQKGLADQTRLHVYNLLHKMFKDAVEFYEVLDKNPVLNRSRPGVCLKEQEFLSPSQSAELLKTVEHEPIGPAIWLSLLVGLRPSEVQALVWKSVEFERLRIVIRASYNRKEKKIQEHPKQEDWGATPIPPMLKKFLESRKSDPDTYVASHNGGMLPYDVFYKKLKKACKKLKIPEISPHGLRHSCTELYVQAGASAEDIRRLLNQKSLAVTQRYIHRTDERLNRVALKVGELHAA